jgi:hypothetical protein
MVCSLDSFAQADLTGVWSCDDGGLYYIRQLGDTVWWYGEQSSSNPAFSNVATGTVDGSTISLDWADVPKGQTTSSGILVLNVESTDTLTAIQNTGGFGGSVWTRMAISPANPAQPGPGTSLPGPTASVPVSSGMGAPTPTTPGTNATGPTTTGSNESLATSLELNPDDPTIVEMF